MTIGHGVLSTGSVDQNYPHRPQRCDAEGFQINNDYMTAVARGYVTGAQPFYGYGERITSGSVSNGLIWPDGALYIPSSAGVQPSIVSTSANDDSVGTGIQSIKVYYIDASLTVQSEIVTLDGLTPVTMAATDVRFINCLHAQTVGSGGVSAGVITISFSGGTMNQMKAGDTRCRSSARMVPAGKRAFIHSMIGGMVSGTASANGHIDIVATEIEGVQYDGIFFPHGEVAIQDGTAVLGMPMPAGPFQAGTIIAMLASTDKASTITGTWYGWIENA